MKDVRGEKRVASSRCSHFLLDERRLFYQQAHAVASVVSLDVNPSIELKVSKSEKVLVCTPLNEDAKAILADMGDGADLKGAKLDVAVNAIVGSLVRNGYLDSISSALNHAGVSEGKAYDMDIELDDEDGRLIYEVEFKSGGREYSYEIDARSGAILKHEAELDD